MLTKKDKLKLISVLATRLYKRLHQNAEILPEQYQGDNLTAMELLLLHLSQSCEEVEQ